MRTKRAFKVKQETFFLFLNMSSLLAFKNKLPKIWWTQPLKIYLASVHYFHTKSGEYFQFYVIRGGMFILGPTMARGIFEASSSFCVGWRTAGRV